MKTIMIPIQPQHCINILSGIKKIEVRKFLIKDLPVRVLMYMTVDCRKVPNIKTETYDRYMWLMYNRGKVVSEFICNKIDCLGNVATDKWKYLSGETHEYCKELVKKACLTEAEILSYGGKFAWNISDLVIYDEPKELGEFKKAGFMTEEEWLFALYPNTHCHYSAWAKKFNITRPPQNYVYVEEV